MKNVLEKAKEKYFQHTQTYGICHYVIKNNKVQKLIIIITRKERYLFIFRFIENVMVNMLDLNYFLMQF